ncbi:uncharacterized protein LOC141913088 isoform X3 [Tubulanus polymorphus]|uniref:uncharacterized protein LOC141913088 isoform X3 n=1 Tax=Tubulanus polymorphus TaxID=672921 RepID=UPI003DA4E64F
MSTNGDKWSSSSQQQQQQQHSAAPWVDEIKLKQSTFGHQLRHNRSKTDDRDLVKSAVDNKHERSTSAETALKKLPISDPATSVKPKLKPGNLPLKPQRVVKSELRSPDDEPIQIRQKSIDKSNVARSVNALTQLFENKNVLIAPSLDFTVEQQTTEQQSAGLENETDSPVRSDRFIVGASDSDDEERKVVSCVKFGRSSKRRKSKENKRSSSKSSSVGSDIDDSTDLATSKFKPSPRPPSFDDVLSEFTHLEQRATDGPLSSPSKPTPPSKPTLPSKPTPPGKPPRTFRHDVYLDSKLNKNHAGPVFVLDPNQQTVTNRQNRDNYEYSSVAVKSTRNNKNDDYFQYDADFSCLRKPKNTAGFSDNSESGENLYESLNRPLKSATVAATEVIYAAPDSSNHSILKRTLSETDQNEYQYVRTIVDTFGVSQDRVRQHALGSDLQSQRSNLQSQRSNLQSQRSTSDECLYARTMSINSDSSTYTDPVEVFSRPVPRQSKQEDVYSAINIPIRNRMLRNPVTTSTRESIDELKKWHAEQKPKLHKIKKLFSQENLLKNMMTSHEQKANKKKARSKIWQIFSGTHRTAAESADEQDSKSNGSGSQFDERDIERQIKRTRSNREKWASVYTRIRAFRKLIYPSLFDYAIIVGVKKVEGNLIPYIKYKFPHNVKPEEFCIPQFCFPDVSIIKPYSEFKSETYSFVLTNCDGSRNYGYCQRFLPSGKLEVYPIVVCIVSPCGAQSLYHQILSEIEKRYLEQEDLATTFIEIAYSRPLPKPGNTISICVINTDGLVADNRFQRQEDARFENVSYDNMVQVLGIDNVLKIFASMLSERRIIFSATNLGTLSSCIHAMVALLYPLSWQHTFIPVLPPEMIDIVCSPTPYIVGILTEFMDDVYDLPMEEVLIVNIDEICLYREQKDELTILPNKLRRALFQALQMSFSEPDDATRNLMISEAFMHYFLMTIRHYEDYINVQHDGQKIFQKELFVKSPSSRGIRMFLRWFVETQMFDLFIIDQLEAEAPQSGIFQKQVAEFKESVQQDTGAWSLKDLGKKVKRAFKRRQSRDELNET